MLVHSEDWDNPQRIEFNCYYKLDPYITEAEREDGENVNKLFKILQRMVEAFKHFEKVVNLDDVESAVQAKAYIVQEPFRDIPEGTRLVVTSVKGGETTVYHKILLEEPIVLTSEELAKCKLESDLIEFETRFTLRGRAGKIATYFEKKQTYRVQYIDGTSSDFSHDELVNEIAYSKEMDAVDDGGGELDDKTPYMIPKGKRDIVSSMKQIQIQGKWYNETG